MHKQTRLNPLSLPIAFFGAVIAAGTLLLHLDVSTAGSAVSWIDALFTATSATCVTGLAVVDTGNRFSMFGQGAILAMIQLGGLGIMTYTSLIFYLLHRRISLTDRIAVAQGLLHDMSFNLGRFLMGIIAWTLIVEAVAAAALHGLAPERFSGFSAVFHAVSAFCNAGFSLFPDSLMGFQTDWGINAVFMVLIVSGGIGFSVLMEMAGRFRHRMARPWQKKRQKIPMSWYSRLVLRTTAFLIVGGSVALFLAEYIGYPRDIPGSTELLTALFQSVTCRTAGFNTLDIGRMTNVSLLVMMLLMFVGGAPGSCAGGIKITTFRALGAFVIAHVKGRRQAVIGRFALDRRTVNKALSLLTFSVLIILAATLVLNITEGGEVPHPLARGLFLDILFEVVSAFGTVGLSTGLTPHLTVAGKLIIAAMMFIGRLGPILMVTALASYQTEYRYRWPEESMLVG